MTEQSKYEDDFGIASAKNTEQKSKLEAAFKQASDIRKFEIELYWKRAGYFWALIAVAFAGYFSILSSVAIQSKYFLSFVVSSIGFVFTLAWHLVNRGSKYWQENWENHLDLLEDHVTGPLYKTRLERPANGGFTEKYITGPLAISVSKINQWVSIFVLAIWLTLAIYSFHGPMTATKIAAHGWLKLGAYGTIIFIVIAVVLLMCSAATRTHQADHTPDIRRRNTTVRKKIQ
nr:hypothetical protein [uncultured Massilia sp.]